MLDDELPELYQEVILDHQKNPRNFRELPQATHKAKGFNPFCGDWINVFLVMDGDVIREATFKGAGCAISTASASLMTDALIGKTRDEAEAMFDWFRSLVTSQTVRQAGSDGDSSKPGKLRVLSGVREFPARVKCATLAWHTLHAALDEENDMVSTE